MIKELSGTLDIEKEVSSFNVNDLLQMKLCNVLFMLYAEDISTRNTNTIAHCFRSKLGIEEKDFSDQRAWSIMKKINKAKKLKQTENGCSEG